MSLGRALPWLKLGVGAVLFAYIARGIDVDLFRGIGDRWLDFTVHFSVAMLLYLAAFSVTVLRWNLLLAAFEVPHRLSDTFRLGWVGLLFSQITPGATGGDLVKGYYIARESPERRVEAVLSVILDRVVGLTGLMLLGSAAVASSWETVRDHRGLEALVWVLVIGVASVFGGGAMLAWEGLWQTSGMRAIHERLPGRRFFKVLARALWTVKGKRRMLLLSMLISLLNHSIIVVLHVFLWRAMSGAYPAIGSFFFLIPVGQLANALPVSPGGLGVGEAAYGKLFSIAGLGHGSELAIFMRLTTLVWATVGLYYYLRGRSALKEAARAAESDEIIDLAGSAEKAGIGS